MGTGSANGPGAKGSTDSVRIRDEALKTGALQPVTRSPCNAATWASSSSVRRSASACRYSRWLCAARR